MTATAANAFAEMQRLSRQLNDALTLLHGQVNAYAAAEADYRRGKARAWAECPKEKGTIAAEREAMVDAATSDLRQVRDLADGMRQAALEAVRSRRAQISALQTLMNGYRAEAEFARTGPAGLAS